MASLGFRPIAVLAILLAASASAQPAVPGRCSAALAEAERAYVERSYEASESLALDCTYLSEASPAELARAHRLLALTYIKADRLADARLMVVRLVAADTDYAADPTVDLPAYVALVDAVRAQLRLGGAAPPGASPEASPAQADLSGDQSSSSALERVNVNTADADALDTVPGIGPALAGRILRHRDANGPFRHVAELEAVRGIGPRSLERMEPYITVGSGRVVVPSELPDARPEADVPAGPRINVNTATAAELETLPRIGPALAQRIIDFRTNYGAFRSVDELELVRGIGPRTIEGFADLVTVE